MGKALLATGVAKEQLSTLAPEQVGVGVPRAAESVAIGFMGLTEQLGPHSPHWASLQVDISAAYQEGDRTTMLRGAQTDTPCLFNYLHFAYCSLHYSSSLVACCIRKAVCTKGAL